MSGRSIGTAAKCEDSETALIQFRGEPKMRDENTRANGVAIQCSGGLA